MATEAFSIEAMVRGCHVYQDSWDATIGEQLPLCKDLFAVAVVRPSAVCQRRYRVCAPCVVVQFTVE